MEASGAAPDLVGRTSARLTALGVARTERLEALHLLAILDASVDVTGRVKRPIDDLAAEFEVPALVTLRSLHHLEAAGAVQHDGATVLLLDRDADGVGGLHLAAFLDDVRSALEDHPNAHRARRLRPARAGVALMAVAAAAAVLALAHNEPLVVEHPVASAPRSAPAPQVSEVAGGLPSPDAAVATSESSPATSADAAVDAAVDAAAGAAVVTAAGRCPSGVPTATFDGRVLRLVNPTTSAITVTAVKIGGAETTSEITVPAGETVAHDVGIVSPSPLPASVDEWDWADPAIARSCPS